VRTAPESVLTSEEAALLTKLARSKLSRASGSFHSHVLIMAEYGGTIFRDTNKQRLRREVFTSVQELKAAIDKYIVHHNKGSKPFIAA